MRALAILTVACLCLAARADLTAKKKKPPASKCGPGSDVGALGRLISLRGEGKAATALFERSCAQSDGPGCYQLGTQFNIGQGGVARDEVRAGELFARARQLAEKGCTGGCQRDCATLAWMLHTGQGVPHDGPRSIALMKAACDGGSPEGCFLLSTMLSFAYETPKDAAGAVAAAKRSCELDDPLGCNSVAYHYEKGDGAPLDPAQATRFYKKSCDLGLQASCKKLR
jgi:hypothetical protein